MTLTAIDATISDERRNLDLRACARDYAVIKASKEFALIANRSALLLLDNLHEVEDVMQFVDAAMALAYRLGYKTREQEIGVRELEAFFGGQESKK